MRVALVANPQSAHVQRWYTALAERGIDCRIFAPPETIDVLGSAVPIGRRGLSGPISTVVRVLQLRSALKDFAPDVVHAHYAYNYGFWAVLAGRHPTVVTCWGSDVLVAPQVSRLNRVKVKCALRWADAVTADSQNLLETARELGASRDALSQIVFGVDVANAIQSRDLGSGDIPVVLSTRRLQPIYRIPDILEACSLLNERGVEFRAVIASSGSEADRLSGMSVGLGLGSVVTFRGRYEDSELRELYAAAAVYVTVPESDGTSVSLLEAMAAGLPVVASDLPANREWLDDRQIVPVGNPTVIAERLESLILDPVLRGSVGQRNRNIVMEYGDWDIEVGKMMSLYTNLLRDKGRR